jgi:hypothetical protein
LPPRNLRKVTRPQVQRKPSHGRDSVDQETRPRATKKPPKVAMIGAAAFATAVRNGGELFTLSFQQMQELCSVSASEVSPALEESLLRYVPPEYHEFADVFSKTEAHKLPPHREYDHRIAIPDNVTPRSALATACRQQRTRSSVNTFKKTSRRDLSDTLNPHVEPRSCSSRKPMAPCAYASITED